MLPTQSRALSQVSLQTPNNTLKARKKGSTPCSTHNIVTKTTLMTHQPQATMGALHRKVHTYQNNTPHYHHQKPSIISYNTKPPQNTSLTHSPSPNHSIHPAPPSTKYQISYYPTKSLPYVPNRYHIIQSLNLTYSLTPVTQSSH